MVKTFYNQSLSIMCPPYGQSHTNLMDAKMGKRGFSVICGLFFFAAAYCPGQTPSLQAAIWQTAVAIRAESFTLAPGALLYEQYQIDKNGKMGRSETGRIGLTYDEGGKAAVSVVWAKRGENDFTAERAGRLEKQASRRNEFLSYFTPFDPDLQDRLTWTGGTRVFAEGKLLWQYEFSLPMNKQRGFTGTARVDDNGRPYDFSFTLSPKPFYLDIMEVHIVFDNDREHLVFSRIDYKYEASFLFWNWKGGGHADFDDWRWIAAPPRLH